jgi:hypothetical protein
MKKTIKTILVALLFIGTIFAACISANANVFTLKKIKTTNEGYGNINGTVYEWGGGPLENAYVYIAGGHISLADFDISVVLSQNQTNIQGYYCIEDIPDGKYTILVLRNGFGKQDKWIPALRHTTVYPGETTTENFNLQRRGRSRLDIIQNHFPQIYEIFLQKFILKFF